MEKELASLFMDHFGAEPSECVPIPQSGSNRSYFRLSGPDHSAIGTYSTDTVENSTFITLARHFKSKGLNVPEVYAVSPDGKCYLQEDLGDTSLFDFVSQGRARALSGIYSPKEDDIYSEEEEAALSTAVAELPRLQLLGAEGLDFSLCRPDPAFDSRTVMYDLNYFKYCFLKPSGIDFNESLLQDDFEKLRDDLLSEPFDSFMYRDFQARNVMMRDGVPYFIDFQGGRKGPVYYDLASFLWQAKAAYPEDLKDRLTDVYLESCEKVTPGRMPAKADFIKRLKLFVLFRILQVLGAYGFRGRIEGKRHFIESIPFALANLRALKVRQFTDYPYLAGILAKISEQREDTEPRAVRTETKPQASLTITVYSFSYRRGLPEDSSGNGGGYVFDCRGINNPGRFPEFRNSNGRDEDVIRFLENDGGVFPFLDHAVALVSPHVKTFVERGFISLMVSFGCTGGQHRSVYCAENFSRRLIEIFGPAIRIHIIHREQGIDEIMTL